MSGTITSSRIPTWESSTRYSSTLLFVSQEISTDVAQEALGLGAMGYEVQTNAGIEVLAAVEALFQGRRFVGASLAGHTPAELADR
jgi:hypothetical protein